MTLNYVYKYFMIMEDKTMSVVINLEKSFFTEKKKLFASHGKIEVYLFTYETGVLAIEIKNELGNVIMLPYQGQQIWRCSFQGKELTMKSTFDQPIPTNSYLSTYGGFFLHCGATAMGVPGKNDNHPLHGDLPNAPYDKAFLVFDYDDKGRACVKLGGVYNHKYAFSINYTAKPLIVIYEGETLLDVSIEIINNRSSSMDLMYLQHINFNPVDGSQLIYSAPCIPENITVYIDELAGVDPEKVKKLHEYQKLMKKDPSIHNKVDPSQPYDPEIVCSFRYLADEDGNAHCMQLLPDGYAYYVSHKPEQLDHGVRWIARTIDEDAMGMILPATADHKGYQEEKRKGNVKTLAGKSAVTFSSKVGLLAPVEAVKIKNKIEKILREDSEQK